MLNTARLNTSAADLDALRAQIRASYSAAQFEVFPRVLHGAPADVIEQRTAALRAAFLHQVGHELPHADALIDPKALARAVGWVNALMGEIDSGMDCRITVGSTTLTSVLPRD